jgi:hypothetical protein
MIGSVYLEAMNARDAPRLCGEVIHKIRVLGFKVVAIGCVGLGAGGNMHAIPEVLIKSIGLDCSLASLAYEQVVGRVDTQVPQVKISVGNELVIICLERSGVHFKAGGSHTATHVPLAEIRHAQ